jgi:heme exporter protein D
MIPLDHDGIFILAAYLGAALGALGLILYAVLDARRVKARLAALEAQGIRRRSDRRPTAPNPGAGQS